MAGEPLPEEFREALQASAARRGAFGDPAVFFSEIGSTNDAAIERAERGAPEGAMVLALTQTAGRGRLGRRWFSPPGAGLYVSVVCRDARAAPRLTLAGGVAVADAIRRTTGLAVTIKWPNDVVVADRTAPARHRKIAGLLAEGSTRAEGLQFVVLGCGINLRPAVYPSDLAWRASSIEAELGRPIDAPALLAEMLALLNEHLTELAHSRDTPLLERWRALAPTATGARVEWHANGATVRGVTGGIDEKGALLICSGHRTERVIAGEVRWL